MARNKGKQPNIDKSDLVRYPDGRIKNNTGGGDGTPVNEATKGDLHEFFDKVMRLYGIVHNDLPDNEENGYQYVDALIALASKNDFVLPLTDVNGQLSIPLKLGKLRTDESLVLKASIDKAAQTTIKGIDGISKVVTYLGSFKAEEYVRLINTSNSVVLVRMIDSFNLESAVNDLSFLKATTAVKEEAGTDNSVGTTPLSNKTIFTKRVIGDLSPNFLASATRNGLMSKEHFTAIEEFGDPLSLIKITSATDIQVNGWQTGANQNNYNFNYVDVYPPTDKDMSNLKGFICSFAEDWQYGKSNDDTFCKYKIEANKIRVICGNASGEKAPHVNWLAIWI